MAELYGVLKQSISQHINRIYADGELTPEATVKKYLTVQTEGKRQVSRNQEHYNLQLIIAVGFKALFDKGPFKKSMNDSSFSIMSSLNIVTTSGKLNGL